MAGAGVEPEIEEIIMRDTEREAEQRVVQRSVVMAGVAGQPQVFIQNAEMVTSGAIHITNYSGSSTKSKRTKPSKPLTTSTEVPTTTHLSYLSERLGPSWTRLGRALGIDDDWLDQVEENHKRDATERNYQMLRHWKQRSGDAATKAALAKHLAKSGLGKLADYLSEH